MRVEGKRCQGAEVEWRGAGMAERAYLSASFHQIQNCVSVSGLLQ